MKAQALYFLRNIIPDPAFELPRNWSNNELKRFAHLFTGDVINVSAWKDEDKQGKHYSDYFVNAISYSLSNYKSEYRGWQDNLQSQIFIDLEEDITSDLCASFDVVYNHTTLEHVFEIGKAFENICRMTRDIVVLVVPFLQEQHASYGDYWRMTPLAIHKLFLKNNLTPIYMNYNNHPSSSVYIFAIASRNPSKWKNIEETPANKLSVLKDSFLGKRALKRSLLSHISKKLRSILAN